MATIVYPASRILTVDPDNSVAAAVAVADGFIVGVGDVETLASMPDATVDDRFADQVITPGFIEAHSHTLEGSLWHFLYTGRFGRRGPDGTWWPDCPTVGDVLARLAEAEAALDDPDAPLYAWGFDPIYYPGARLSAADLDTVSSTRPIFVFHASSHIATVNSELLQRAGIDADTVMEGVVKDDDGWPTGELAEPPAMALAGTALREIFSKVIDPESLWNFAFSARNSGVTTITELGAVNVSNPVVPDLWDDLANREDFPARAVLFTNPNSGAGIADIEGFLDDIRQRSSDKVRYGQVKLFTDGSIQGFTARLAAPGYHNGAANGIWLTAPEQLTEMVERLHRARVSFHCHCNGDEATEVFVAAVERAMELDPWADHRHTVTHSQMTTAAQYRRMAAIGMCANIFSNHIYFWGDQHVESTIGPERAARMNACATAGAAGVRYSIHSDASVTPLGHLHTMWCAATRRTASGAVLGPDERIPAAQALRAATIDAAFLLRLDDEIGSIEVGKRADFAVLDADPTTVDPETIRDIGVWGTVVGGRLFPAPGRE